MRLGKVNLMKHVIGRATTLNEKEITVQAPWGKIAAATWGNSAGTPVLLGHGKMDSLATFRPLVDLLPPNFFYVGLDLPGNGKSDFLPKGMPISVFDYVPTIKAVVDHFQWTKFLLVAHSLSVSIGKFFDIAYPGTIGATVDLDPIPAYETREVDSLCEWYHYVYGDYYTKERYRVANASTETAPKFTMKKAVQMQKDMRGVTEEGARALLERNIESAGDGLFRYTYDQRVKVIMRPPFPSKVLEEIYTSISTPTLTILAEDSIEMGFFNTVPFIWEENKYKGGCNKVMRVPGNHDVHFNNPEVIAPAVAKFLADYS